MNRPTASRREFRHGPCLKAAALVWLLLTPDADARLGENVEACVKRYGKPVEIHKGGPTNDLFSVGDVEPFLRFKVNAQDATGGLEVRCWFARAEPDAVCEAITYQFPRDMDEIRAFLEANRQDSKWRLPKFYEETTEWQREDGGLAVHGRHSGLWIYDKERGKKMRPDRTKGL